MTKMKTLLGSLLAGGVLALIHLAFSKAGSSRSIPSGTSYDAVDEYVEAQMHRLRIPGASLAIVEGDRVMHYRGFGRVRPGGETPSPQTPFSIGSITKSFTALAVMQLVEAGKVELDAPVQRFLPWFRVADPQASAQMTVRHLLNQTSGLPTSTGELIAVDFDNRPGAAERQARALSTLLLARPVGAAYEYSNSNYQLLGLIVEAASGQSYADYVQEHILAPLEMRHSYTSLDKAKQNGLAVVNQVLGHQYWFAVPFASSAKPLPRGALAGGGLISCAEDMAHYLIAHLNGGRYEGVRILSGTGIDELHHGVVDLGVEALPAELRLARPWLKGLSLGRCGMGWFIDIIGQAEVVWHGGTLPDVFAYLALLPGQKKGVALLFNADHHWMSPVLTEVGMGVAALLAGEQPAPLPFFRMIPWALRGLLFIPALQTAGVVATLRQLRRWHLDPERRPSSRCAWGRQLLFPLVPNLMLAFTVIPMLGKRRGYLMLYKPDSSWTVLVCGTFALVWSFLRTGLLLRAMKTASSHQTLDRQPVARQGA
jgi:CubicO group peptidase (beta-lactamase class C family)